MSLSDVSSEIKVQCVCERETESLEIAKTNGVTANNFYRVYSF